MALQPRKRQLQRNEDAIWGHRSQHDSDIKPKPRSAEQLVPIVVVGGVSLQRQVAPSCLPCLAHECLSCGLLSWGHSWQKSVKFVPKHLVRVSEGKFELTNTGPSQPSCPAGSWDRHQPSRTIPAQQSACFWASGGWLPMLARPRKPHCKLV